MDPDRWQRLERAFHRYGDLGDRERAELLDELGRIDPELKAELLRMVAEDASDPRFLEPPTSSPLPLLDTAAATPAAKLAPGTRLGAYRVLEWVASGGMGAVYRAERADDQFDQVVAVKVLAAGAAHPTLRQRFHQERQTLAFLNHPNVAKLIDGGNTDDGLPYLVMEFVDGRPIDRFCDGHALSIEERLRLFATVLDAVHHLHQSLVVHRDIKPSNILVDEQGRPKRLDFGIAKLLDDDRRADDVDATMTGLRLMTPRFASPEQVRGESVTTASDIYSLGVLLYRLLSGHEPYALADVPLHEFERAVCEDDPQRPSTAVRREPTAAEIALGRATSVERLRRRLEGDLDTVVLKAMRKSPGDRYGSAQQFAEDIRNVLAHRPVIARRTPVHQRLVKLAQRNRLGAVLTAALLLSVVAGAGGIVWWAGRTRAESRRADREAEAARYE